MPTNIEGIYRNGRVEFTEQPKDLPEGMSVIVTFMDNPNDIDLASQGIDREQAKTLISNFSTFSEDWNSEEMSVYDNYDYSVKSHL